MSQAVGGSKGTMAFAEQKRIRSYGLTEHGWYGKTTKVDLTSVTTRRTRTTRNTTSTLIKDERDSMLRMSR